MTDIEPVEEPEEIPELAAPTDDPDDWEQLNPEIYSWLGKPLWKHKDRTDLFSTDGGKTYYLVSEATDDTSDNPVHESIKKEK